MPDHRGGIRAVLAIAVAACTVIAGMLGPASAADPSGVIKGRVTQAGSPVVGIFVETFDGPTKGFAITDADGRYEMTGLATGTYRVRFDDYEEKYGFPTEFYQHKPFREQAVPVQVTDGATTGGIDTDMVEGGAISGRVTGAGGVPLAGICVETRDFLRFRKTQSTVTDADGRYRIPALLQEQYLLRFLDCEQLHNVAGEYYDDQRTDVYAKPIEVPQGEEVTDIDAQLARYASIAGRVTAPGRTGLGCLVGAYDSDGNRLGLQTFVDTDGSYLLEQVYPGEGARVQFDCEASGGPVAKEWYADRQTSFSATPLSIPPGTALTGIDGVVGAPSSIGGRATDSAGDPLADVCVTTHQGGFGPLEQATTDADGRYQVDGLTAGDFEVRFRDCDPSTGRKLGTTWYGGGAAPESAETVPTVAGQTSGDVDAVLVTDDTAPDTVITGGPAEGAIVSDFPVTMSFAATVAEPDLTFECRLDGGGWFGCASPYHYIGLKPTNVFEVRATDAVGNTDPTPAKRTFVFDDGPPETRITAGPANGATVSGAVSYSFDGQPAFDTARLECRVDSGAWATCTSPRTVSGLADGSHSFAVRAIDAYGQVDLTPAARSFVVNAAACTAARRDLSTAQAALPAATRRQSSAQAALTQAARKVRSLKAAVKKAPKARKPALQRKLKAAVTRQKSASSALSSAKAGVSRARAAVSAAQRRVDQSC